MSTQPQTTRPCINTIDPCLLNIVEEELSFYTDDGCRDELSCINDMGHAITTRVVEPIERRPLNHWLLHSPERQAFREQ